MIIKKINFAYLIILILLDVSAVYPRITVKGGYCYEQAVSFVGEYGEKKIFLNDGTSTLALNYVLGLGFGSLYGIVQDVAGNLVLSTGNGNAYLYKDNGSQMTDVATIGSATWGNGAGAIRKDQLFAMTAKKDSVIIIKNIPLGWYRDQAIAIPGASDKNYIQDLVFIGNYGLASVYNLKTLYLFSRSTGVWTIVDTISDLTLNFGHNLKESGNQVLVQAGNAIKIFRLEGDSLVYIETIQSPNAEESKMGESFSFDGNTISFSTVSGDSTFYYIYKYVNEAWNYYYKFKSFKLSSNKMAYNKNLLAIGHKSSSNYVCDGEVKTLALPHFIGTNGEYSGFIDEINISVKDGVQFEFVFKHEWYLTSSDNKCNISFSNLPIWATSNQNIISGTPDDPYLDPNYSTAHISCPEGTEDVILQWKVTSVNEFPPRIYSPNFFYVDSERSYQYVGKATDKDLDKLTWTWNLPIWMVVSGSNTVEGIHPSNFTGDYFMGIVTDGFFSDSIVVEIRKPGLKITSPNGGEVWETGSSQSVRFEGGGFEGSIYMDYSTDNGLTWVKASGSALISTSKSNGTILWTTPNTLSDKYKIKVYRATDKNVFDISDNSFEITSQPVPKSITIISPSKNDTVYSNSTYAIKWTSTGDISKTKIDYAIDSVWTLIVDSVENSGEFTWSVPYIISNNIMIRVSNFNGLESDSSIPFVILNKFGLTLTSPIGGEVWRQGVEQQIKWKSTGTFSTVKIEYLNGNSWKEISPNAPNTGVFNWVVPEQVPDSSRIRITGLGITAIDESSFFFINKNIVDIKIIKSNGSNYKILGLEGFPFDIDEISVLRLNGALVMSKKIVRNESVIEFNNNNMNENILFFRISYKSPNGKQYKTYLLPFLN